MNRTIERSMHYTFTADRFGSNDINDSNENRKQRTWKLVVVIDRNDNNKNKMKSDSETIEKGNEKKWTKLANDCSEIVCTQNTLFCYFHVHVSIIIVIRWLMLLLVACSIHFVCGFNLFFFFALFLCSIIICMVKFSEAKIVNQKSMKKRAETQNWANFFILSQFYSVIKSCFDDVML